MPTAAPTLASVLPIDEVRARFPALARAAPFIYFDNAAGAQAPQSVLDGRRRATCWTSTSSAAAATPRASRSTG